MIAYYLLEEFEIKTSKQIDFKGKKEQQINELVYEIMKETDKLIQRSALFKIDKPIIEKD